jgi:hypothetical protein
MRMAVLDLLRSKKRKYTHGDLNEFVGSRYIWLPAR